MGEVSPTARALLTLELLQNRPGITGAEIADRLGVTSRAARRYIAILREAGIPVQSVSGPAGGYRPGRGVRPPPLMFTSDEAIGLVMAALDGHHQVDGVDDPVSSALGKLLRTLPEAVAAQARIIRTTAAAAPDSGAVRPDPGITAELVEACAEHIPVRLDYCTESGSERVFEVEPWTVVVRHGRWYLLCHSRTADATRAYRVDRVHRVSRLPGRVVVPEGLDPVAALEEHLATGWEYEIEIVIDAPLGKLEWLPRNLGRLTADGDRTRLVGTTSDPRTYAYMLVAVPAPYRVVRGEELRAVLRDLGRRFVDAADPPD